MAAGPFWSERFQRHVWLTHHALIRALERNISPDLILEIVETGTLVEREGGHCWIWKSIEAGHDNLLCLAALLGNALIVKTVMNHFEPEGL